MRRKILLFVMTAAALFTIVLPVMAAAFPRMLIFHWTGRLAGMSSEKGMCAFFIYDSTFPPGVQWTIAKSIGGGPNPIGVIIPRPTLADRRVRMGLGPVYVSAFQVGTAMGIYFPCWLPAGIVLPLTSLTWFVPRKRSSKTAFPMEWATATAPGSSSSASCTGAS